MSVHKHVVADGTASGIAIAGNVKIIGAQSLGTEKNFRVYSGTAATEANMIIQVGADMGHRSEMFPAGREQPANGVYVAVDNAHGGIIWYMD